MTSERPSLDQLVEHFEANGHAGCAEVVRLAMRDVERQGAKLGAARRRVEELESEVGRLRAALREIADRAWVEHLAEPRWASTVAEAVLTEAP
jgi:hypothetical protein